MQKLRAWRISVKIRLLLEFRGRHKRCHKKSHKKRENSWYISISVQSVSTLTFSVPTAAKGALILLILLSGKDMSLKKSSDAWDFFTKSDNSNATCNICKVSISYKSTSSNLKKHLKRRHIGVFSEMESRKRPAMERSDVDDPIPSTSTSVEVIGQEKKRQRLLSSYVPKKITPQQKKEIDRDLMNLFIKDYQPFSIVEDEGFKKFAKWIPGYDLPNRKTISNSMIPALYHENINLIKEVVSSEAESVCITTDCWTSSISESYLAVTVSDG